MPAKIDWTWAYNGRIKGIDANSTSNDAYIQRFNDELNAGQFVFLRLNYREKLETDIKKIEPKLAKYKTMLLLGIGGSALGAKALQKAFYPEQDMPNYTGKALYIADNIDADALEKWLSRINPAECIVAVVSKSGSTIETVAQYFIVKKWLKEALKAKFSEHLIFVTDEHKGFLCEEAEKLKAPSLEVPDNMGGRYSVFSAVGILPAAFLGINWRALLDGAADFAKTLLTDTNKLTEHNAWKLAHFAYSLYLRQYSELIFFNYVPKFSCLGAWFMQLWAESLGKEKKGTMPISAIGVTDQHSILQMFLDGQKNKACLFVTSQSINKGEVFTKEMLPKKWSYLEDKRFGDLLEAEALGTKMALTNANMPLVELNLQAEDEYSLAGLMCFLMSATIFTGYLLNINPINQDAVELGKALANAKLGADGYANEQKELEKFLKNTKKINAW